MRNILTPLFRATLLMIVSFVTLSGLCAQEKPGGFRDLPVRNEIHRQYQLAPNTTVEISLIAGPVEIETTTGESAEIHIVNSAETQADLDCSVIPIEHTPEKLVIRSNSITPLAYSAKPTRLSRSANRGSKRRLLGKYGLTLRKRKSLDRASKAFSSHSNA